MGKCDTEELEVLTMTMSFRQPVQTIPLEQQAGHPHLSTVHNIVPHPPPHMSPTLSFGMLGASVMSAALSILKLVVVVTSAGTIVAVMIGTLTSSSRLVVGVITGQLLTTPGFCSIVSAHVR